MKPSRVILIIVASVATIFCGLCAAAAQDVKTLPQGEKEVHFRGDCIVFYDKRDERTHAQPGCSRDQIQRADRMIADGDYGDSSDEPPEIIMGGNGEAEVVFNNNCVVYYDRHGQRKNANSNCDRDQKRRADHAMASYRREQGLAGGSASHSGDYRGEGRRIIGGKGAQPRSASDGLIKQWSRTAAVGHAVDRRRQEQLERA